MKILSKSSIQRLSAALLFTVSFVALPVSAHAIEGTDTNSTSEVKKKVETQTKQVICQSFDNIIAKTSSEVTKKGSVASSEWANRATQIQKNRTAWNDRVVAGRAEAETNRNENFAKLDELAKTDEQKAAVATYKEKILAAVAVRQAAHDANKAAYFKAVDALIASQKANSSGDVSGLTAKINAALTTAKNSCTSGASADQVRSQLVASLKSARESFKSERKSDSSTFKAQLEQLKTTRKTANAEANATFKATAQAARTELKAAFPTTDETV